MLRKISSRIMVKKEYLYDNPWRIAHEIAKLYDVDEESLIQLHVAGITFEKICYTLALNDLP